MQENTYLQYIIKTKKSKSKCIPVLPFPVLDSCTVTCMTPVRRRVGSVFY